MDKFLMMCIIYIDTVTKEKMIIPEAKVPAFKPGRSFKEAVNK